MFEQSILNDHTGARKTGVFAASLMAQIALTGVLLLAPLIYQDVLPKVHLSEIVSMPVRPLPPAPPTVEPTPTTHRESLASPIEFRPQTHAPQTVPQTTPTIIDNNAPLLSYLPATVGDGLPLDVIPATTRLERPTPTPAAKPIPPPEPQGPVPVSGGVQAAKLLKQVVPVYPPLAIRMRVSGTVRLLGIIGKDGKIQNLQVINGNPLLTAAALDAVRQWVYSPTVLSGKAVEVEAPIDVIFTLTR